MNVKNKKAPISIVENRNMPYDEVHFDISGPVLPSLGGRTIKIIY